MKKKSQFWKEATKVLVRTHMHTRRALPHLSAVRSGAQHLTSHALSSLPGMMIPDPSESPGLPQMVS